MSTITKTKEHSYYLTIVAGDNGIITRYTFGILQSNNPHSLSEDVIECKVKLDDDECDCIITEFFTHDEFDEFERRLDVLRSIDDCIYSPKLSVVYNESEE